MDDLVDDYFRDLAELNQEKNPDQDFFVQLRCMVCDAPQRAECKSVIGQGGYNSCERCIQRGIRIPRKKGHVTALPDLNAPLRTMENWTTYGRFNSRKAEVCFYLRKLFICYGLIFHIQRLLKTYSTRILINVYPD